MELCDIAGSWGAPWYRDPTVGNGYPILQWQYDRGDYRLICGFDIDKDPTSLTPALSEGEGVGTIYDLSGRTIVNGTPRLQSRLGAKASEKLSNSKLERGIYIINGRKVVK